MSQEVITNIVLSIFGLLISGLFIILTSLVSSLGKHSERLVRIETTIDLMGLNAAKTLHSPHTPNLDKLLDKYIDRNYELSSSEWSELLQRCETIVADHSQTRDYRLNAAMLAAVCHHKLMHDPKNVKRVPLI